MVPSGDVREYILTERPSLTHDVTYAKLVSLNNKTAAMLVLWEFNLFLLLKLSFVYFWDARVTGGPLWVKHRGLMVWSFM